MEQTQAVIRYRWLAGIASGLRKAALPAGYQIPAHSHPTTEALTVLSGKLLIGMGDKLDEKKGTVLTTGAYAEAPAKMNHYAVAKSPSVIQVHGKGPMEITYVDKADDPRNAPAR